MFGDMDIDCNKDCPSKIRSLCDSNFSKELENIIHLAVSKARYKTLEEIHSNLNDWNVYKEIQPIPYSGDTDEHVELRRSAAEYIKDDIMCEIKYKMDDENKIIKELTNDLEREK